MQGIFRYTDEHHSERRLKTSLYNVVYIEPGSENEIIPIEISYNIGTKAAMIAVKSASGQKQQRSHVVKGESIQDAFPITMLEN